jgi:hypothetical protein
LLLVAWLTVRTGGYYGRGIRRGGLIGEFLLGVRDSSRPDAPPSETCAATGGTKEQETHEKVAFSRWDGWVPATASRSCTSCRRSCARTGRHAHDPLRSALGSDCAAAYGGRAAAAPGPAAGREAARVDPAHQVRGGGVVVVQSVSLTRGLMQLDRDQGQVR